MGFVRAKTIKGKKYAYLVQNEWKKGKVKQKVKKYLGPIISLSSRHKLEPSHIDFSQPTKHIMRELISHELLQRGFVQKRQTLTKDDVVVNLSRFKITKSNKPAVLMLNDRYVYPSLLRYLIHFYEPEDDDSRKGEKLAKALSDAGIPISHEQFIFLYKKIYLSQDMLKKNSSFENNK